MPVTRTLFLVASSNAYCSDPSWGGGGGTIYSTGFIFVQSILADRYIHHRELRLVSLKSFSSVEYGIKKIFWFSFLTGRYRGLNFRENRVNSVDFIHLFSEFFIKIWRILMKFNKTFHENVVDFPFKDKIHCRLFSLNFFLSQILAKNFTKFRLFHQKQHEINFFSPLWLKLQAQTPLTQSL